MRDQAELGNQMQSPLLSLMKTTPSLRTGRPCGVKNVETLNIYSVILRELLFPS
jgi:hypothetical protein